MNEDRQKKVNTGIFKKMSLPTYLCQYTHTFGASLSSILNFQLNSLLGDSLRGFHTTKVSGEIHQTVLS